MPPLVEDVKTCFRNHNQFVAVLRLIARGRVDGGGPLDAEMVRRLARDALYRCNITILTGEDDEP